MDYTTITRDSSPLLNSYIKENAIPCLRVLYLSKSGRISFTLSSEEGHKAYWELERMESLTGLKEYHRPRPTLFKRLWNRLKRYW